MSYLPQPAVSQRPVRIRPEEFTPAVLRVDDGSCTSGALELFSLTGGLLSLPKVLDKGTQAKLLFLTQTGPILGVAELLQPVSRREQPFRFLTLHADDQNRLWTATHQAPKPLTPEAVAEKLERPTLTAEQIAESTREVQWIEKYRTAIEDSGPPRKRSQWKFFAAITAATLGMGVVYALQSHLLR